MTNTLPTPTVPEWSINSPPEISLDHSPDDHDFFDRLLLLKPENQSKKHSVAEERTTPDAVVNLDSQANDNIAHGQKPPSNGLVSSSKPTTLPPNALRLHLDDPSAPLTTHNPVHPSSNTSNADLRPNRVRFRSRVRITSGFSRHRRKSDVGSSRSDSPSSSISAPLRSPADDGTNTWGTLGQRVGLLALQKKILGSPKAQRRRNGTFVPTQNVDERTPLRNSSNHLPYVEGEGVQDRDIFNEDSDDERLSQEVDDVFGKFPGRLLNHHWWYWQLEPIICCHYAADFE